MKRYEYDAILHETADDDGAFVSFPWDIRQEFGEAFGYGFLLWTIVNLWDAIVLDIIWFCHDPHFVFKGTEDMVSDYHDYWFHMKGFFIGEAFALAVCAVAGLVVQYDLYF